MKIERALQLQIGDIVHCPPDRGTLGFTGRVTYVTHAIHEASGSKYIWIEVQPVYGSQHTHKSVWPSNRLS